MLYLGANNKILKNPTEYIYLALIQKYITIYKFIKDRASTEAWRTLTEIERKPKCSLLHRSKRSLFDMILGLKMLRICRRLLV